MRDDAAATQFSIDTAHSIWNTRKLLIKLRSGELKNIQAKSTFIRLQRRKWYTRRIQTHRVLHIKIIKFACLLFHSFLFICLQFRYLCVFNVHHFICGTKDFVIKALVFFSFRARRKRFPIRFSSCRMFGTHANHLYLFLFSKIIFDWVWSKLREEKNKRNIFKRSAAANAHTYRR